MLEKQEHIVIFPFMAQGHIIPFVALALRLEKTRNCTISFVNTPLNISNLRSSLPPDSSIQLREIPFNSSDHGLPPNSENCDVLPYPLVVRLLQASLSLRDPFRDLLCRLMEKRSSLALPPLVLIGDIFFGWMADVGQELGLFHAVFSGAGGFGMACYYSMWMKLIHKTAETWEETDEFELPDFPEASKIHRTQLPLSMLEATGTDVWSVFQRKNLPEYTKSDGILFNTVEELDQLGLMYFKRQLGKPVWPIGPVLLSTENRSTSRKVSGVTSGSCREWLDSKPENSVLYVSFGSVNTISLSQMMSLATALEVSGKNFIWVVRPPIGFDINSEFKANEWLPEGFEERIKLSNRGLLIQKWAPQVEILSHKSTSVFLSHCGWNSVLESLSNGVPILGWPMAAEQFFNAKFLVEKIGVCVEVARGKAREVSHEDVVQKIEMAMDENKKGKEMRRNAFEVKKMIENAMKDEEGGLKGSSVRAMDEFFVAAQSMRQETEKQQNVAV